MKLRFCRHCDQFREWPVLVLLRRGRQPGFFRIGRKTKRPEGSLYLIHQAKNPRNPT